MRLIGRNDLFLLLGLTVALFAIVSRPLGRALAFMQDIDESWGLQLLPGLVILAVVFMLHQVRKRHEIRVEALASAAEARQSAGRAAEMERLIGFGQALARSLDYESIRAAVREYLATLGDHRGGWVMVRAGGRWQPLTPGDEAQAVARQRTARRALGEIDSGEETSDDVCFPMIVAGAPVGVLCVAPEPPLTEHKRTTLAAAAALLGVSLKNAELFHEIREKSVRDSLTGCFNRKHALEVMDGELRRSSRSRLPLSLIMFDLDHFKAVNDNYGHLCGDAVLAAVGREMNAVLRGSDLKCRYGGEEFLVLLPDTTLAGGQRAAELLRREIAEHPVRWNTTEIRVTASFGVTAVLPGELDQAAMIGRADAALYQAKEGGRNRVCPAGEREALA